MTRYKFRVKGIDDVKSRLGTEGAVDVHSAVDDEMEKGIKRIAYKSGMEAPIDTGYLRSTIIDSPTKLDHAYYMYGSVAPYAQRQEYEHKTKRGFFRRVFTVEGAKLTDDIAKRVKKTLE